MGEPKWLKDIRKTPGGPRLIALYTRPRAVGEGERLADFVHVTGNEYFRLDQPKPGAYVRCVGPVRAGHDFPAEWVSAPPVCLVCGESAQVESAECVPVSWWYCDPLGHWGIFRRPVTLHADGTISVAGTIVNDTPGVEVGYRGTLTHGVWEPGVADA